MMGSWTNRRQILTGLACFGAGAAITGIGRAGARDYGPMTALELSATDFVPVFSVDYGAVAIAGVQVVSGEPSSFHAALHLPIGTRIKSVFVYIDPNGAQQRVFFVRYRPIEGLEEIGPLISSTAGTEIEEVPIPVNQIVEKEWIYRVAVSNLTAGGASLHGARVEYRLRV
jgi:hypothetical protein